MGLNWRQRQKQELRQQLYDTAVELFIANGYEATTVQQITERLGVAKGTFFNHFPSKEHVVARWYNSITEQSLAEAGRRRFDSAEQAICWLFADLSGRATKVPELLIVKSSQSTHPLLIEAEKAQVEAIHAFVREQCRAAIESGEVATDLDVLPFCGLLVAVLTGTARAWVYTLPRFDFPEVIRQRVEFLFRAIKAQAR